MEDYANYSVLMSVYKKEKAKYLRESIESIINQTVKTNDFCIIKDRRINRRVKWCYI